MNFTITDCVGEEVYWKMAGQKYSKLNLLIGVRKSYRCWYRHIKHQEIQILRQIYPIAITIKRELRDEFH